jgi:hypothetical protein
VKNPHRKIPAVLHHRIPPALPALVVGIYVKPFFYLYTITLSHDDVIKKMKKGGIYKLQRVQFPNPVSAESLSHDDVIEEMKKGGNYKSQRVQFPNPVSAESTDTVTYSLVSFTHVSSPTVGPAPKQSFYYVSYLLLPPPKPPNFGRCLIPSSQRPYLSPIQLSPDNAQTIGLPLPHHCCHCLPVYLFLTVTIRTK